MDLDFLLANKKCMLSKLINLFNPVDQDSYFANNVDPDEMAHDEASHQDLHCLPFCSWLTTNFLLGVMDVSKYRDGRVYFRNSGLKGINLVLKLGQTRFCLYIFLQKETKKQIENLLTDQLDMATSVDKKPISPWGIDSCLWCLFLQTVDCAKIFPIVFLFFILFYTPPQDSDGILWFHVCVCPSVCLLYVHPYFRLRTIAWVNVNGFSPNLLFALILWGFGLGLLMGKFSQFLIELSVWGRSYFHLWILTWVDINGFSPNLLCALILWRSDLGLLMGKFH